MSLDDIGCCYGTDKCSKGHNYLHTYERLLEPLRTQMTAILEVGIWRGQSLFTWRSYYDVKIVGIDINPEVPTMENLGIHTFKADQMKPDQLRAAVYILAPFDVIIDDGCHLPEAQEITFKALWEYLKPGGYYFIEDCSMVASFPPKDWERQFTQMPGESHDFMAWTRKPTRETLVPV